MIRELNIKAVLNGFIVSVGCQTVVFTTREQLLTELEHYLKDPEGTEKRFNDTALNTKFLLGRNQPEPEGVSGRLITADQRYIASNNTVGR